LGISTWSNERVTVFVKRKRKSTSDHERRKREDAFIISGDLAIGAEI